MISNQNAFFIQELLKFNTKKKFNILFSTGLKYFYYTCSVICCDLMAKTLKVREL